MDDGTIIIVMFSIVAFIIILYVLISHAKPFLDELKYVKSRIDETEGEERKHYIRRRRRLWLSLLPFVKY